MTAIAPTGPRAQGVRWDLSRIVTDAAAARSSPTRLAPPATRSPSATAAASPTLDAAGLGDGAERRSPRSTTPSRASGRTSACGAPSTSTTTRRATSRPSSSSSTCRSRNTLRFFELEWIALDDDVAERARVVARGGPRPPPPAQPAPATSRTSCRSPRSACWAERSPGRQTAWQNLFEQTVANVKVLVRPRRRRARPHDRRAARQHVHARPDAADARAGHAVRRRSSR